jgi:acetyl-CoA acyltransferase
MNVGRIAALLAGLPDEVPGMTLNRFCASGLEAVALAADRIRTGQADVLLAGGTESMSLIPMGGASFQPNPRLVKESPDVYLSMGLTAERVARLFGVSREDQDAFALESHRRAVAASDQGRFERETAPVSVVTRRPGPDGEAVETVATVSRDEGPRRDTSLEALRALPPAFLAGGTVTAGNASQMSDGAAALLVMSRSKAEASGLRPRAVFRGYATAGVAPGIMGIGPVVAVPKLLERAGLSVGEIDLFEINEAFASQILHVRRTLGIDPGRLNAWGGAIALGHPLGATGARLAVTLLHQMEERDARWGVAAMCVGGGMGAAALLERDT